ncbi:MAG: L,D-transpeptidase, partial [Actinomycetota bacterium]
MRVHATTLAALLLLAGCGAGSSDDRSATTVTTQSLQAAVVPVADTSPTTTIREPRPVWEGFAASSDASRDLAAMARGPVEVFSSPGDAEPQMTLEATTILDTVTVLAVVDAPGDGWVEVMLPVRPNGSTGWVSTDQVSLYSVDGEIHIDLSERWLTYVVDGVTVLETEVGVGSEHNRTPVGEFFVTDSVTLADPNSPWGPHALGLSARSDTITEFNGADGIIGIHGTNNPGSIGGNISLGCVRLPNDKITALHEMV